MLSIEDVRDIVQEIDLAGPFAEKWFHVGFVSELIGIEKIEPAQAAHELVYVQQRYMEPDIHTGVMAEQRARVWIIPPEASRSQVVQVCFGASLASAEHQVREFFTYRGKRVFGPHMEISDLEEVAR